MGKSITEWFGNANLATKFAIILGALVVLVVIAGLIKLAFDKYRVRKHSVKLAREAALANNNFPESGKAMPKELEEGDLFGVRAIESGFFGGIVQSRPGSAASSRSPSLIGQPVSPATSFSGSPLLRGSPSPSLSGVPHLPGTPPSAPSFALPSRRGSPGPSISSAPNQNFQAKPVLDHAYSNSSLRGPSPLSRAPVVANEPPEPMSRGVSVSHEYLPLPTEKWPHATPSRPSFLSDTGKASSEPGMTLAPLLHLRGNEGPIHVVPSHAPQIDRPSKALSPALRASFVGHVENAKGQESMRTMNSGPIPARPKGANSTRQTTKVHVRSFSRPLSPKSVAPSQLGDLQSSQTIGPSTAQVEKPDRVPGSAAMLSSANRRPSTPAVDAWGPTVFDAIEQSLDESRMAFQSASSATSADHDANPFTDSDARSSSPSSVASLDGTRSASTARTPQPARAGPAVRVPSGSFTAALPSSSGGTFLPPPTRTPPLTEPTERSPRSPPRPPRPASPAIELATLPGSAFPAPPTSPPHRRPASSAALRASTAGLPVGLQAGTPPPLPGASASLAFGSKVERQYRPYSPPAFEASRASLLPPPAPPPSRALPPIPRGAALGAGPGAKGWHGGFGGNVAQRNGLEG